MATPKGDHNPTQYESPWLFCDGVFLCAILINKHVTQHTTVFLTHALLWPIRGVQFAGMVQKDASRKKSEGGGVWSESVGSLSPSSPPPPYFFPVCDFAPHFTNCPEQASSLATSHIVMSNNIGFLRLLHLDFSFLYRKRFFPAKPIT